MTYFDKGQTVEEAVVAVVPAHEHEMRWLVPCQDGCTSSHRVCAVCQWRETDHSNCVAKGETG